MKAADWKKRSGRRHWPNLLIAEYRVRVWRVKTPFPGFVEPALATAVERVPQGERWIHEIKIDGYRVQLQIANEDVKVFTRRGNDWTRRFRKIANDAFLISARQQLSTARS